MTYINSTGLQGIPKDTGPTDYSSFTPQNKIPERRFELGLDEPDDDDIEYCFTKYLEDNDIATESKLLSVFITFGEFTNKSVDDRKINKELFDEYLKKALDNDYLEEINV